MFVRCLLKAYDRIVVGVNHETTNLQNLERKNR